MKEINILDVARRTIRMEASSIQQLDAYLTMFFVVVLWVVIIDTARLAYRYLARKPLLPLSEVPHEPSRMVEDWVRD